MGSGPIDFSGLLRQLWCRILQRLRKSCARLVPFFWVEFRILLYNNVLVFDTLVRRGGRYLCRAESAADADAAAAVGGRRPASLSDDASSSSRLREDFTLDTVGTSWLVRRPRRRRPNSTSRSERRKRNRSVDGDDGNAEWRVTSLPVADADMILQQSPMFLPRGAYET